MPDERIRGELRHLLIHIGATSRSTDLPRERRVADSERAAGERRAPNPLVGSSSSVASSGVAGLCLIGVAIGLAGCAQSRLNHEPGLVTSWDRASASAPSPAPPLTIELYTRHLSFGEPGESLLSKWWTKQKLHEQLKDVKAEFPFLANARWEPADEAREAPYHLVIEATHAIEGNKTLHWFSSTSRYLIPSSETGVVDLRGRVYRSETLLKTYDAVGRYRNKRHLIFLATPWWWGYKVPSRTMEDTFRDLFLQVQRDATTLFSAGGAGS